MTDPPAASAPYRVRDLTDDDLADIEGWRYEGPWSVYDSDGRLDPSLGYWAVEADDGRLAGFGCLGDDARVPGLADAEGVVDVGVGMHPDLVGRGSGARFAAAFLEFAAGRVTADRFRVVVKDWNARSLRLVQRLGFVRTGTHQVRRDGATETYVVLERSVRPG